MNLEPFWSENVVQSGNYCSSFFACGSAEGLSEHLCLCEELKKNVKRVIYKCNAVFMLIGYSLKWVIMINTEIRNYSSSEVISLRAHIITK